MTKLTLVRFNGKNVFVQLPVDDDGKVRVSNEAAAKMTGQAIVRGVRIFGVNARFPYNRQGAIWC
jgi:hypothetical protein